MFVDKTARAESRELIHSEDTVLSSFILDALPDDDPQAIGRVLDDLKPRQYAALAGIVEKVVDEVMDTSLADVVSTAPRYGQIFTPFQDLRSRALEAFSDAIDHNTEADEFRTAETFTLLVGGLDHNRHIHLKTQLMAGADTATTIMLGLLRGMPEIINHHAPRDTITTSELVGIARRSTSLPWQLAMMRVEQMMAVRDLGIVSNEQIEDEEEAAIDPRFFAVSRKAGRIVSVHLVDLASLEVPAGYRPIEYLKETTTSTALIDYKTGSRTPIGCPVTLLPNRLPRLWNWYITAIEEEDTWARESEFVDDFDVSP